MNPLRKGGYGNHLNVGETGKRLTTRSSRGAAKAAAQNETPIIVAKSKKLPSVLSNSPRKYDRLFDVKPTKVIEEFESGDENSFFGSPVKPATLIRADA
jgi:hypothetical protein